MAQQRILIGAARHLGQIVPHGPLRVQHPVATQDAGQKGGQGFGHGKDDMLAVGSAPAAKPFKGQLAAMHHQKGISPAGIKPLVKLVRDPLMGKGQITYGLTGLFDRVAVGAGMNRCGGQNLADMGKGPARKDRLAPVRQCHLPVRRRWKCLHDLFRIHRHLPAIAHFTGWASPSDMNGPRIGEGGISRIMADQQSRYAAITNLRPHKPAKALAQLWIKC